MFEKWLLFLQNYNNVNKETFGSHLQMKSMCHFRYDVCYQRRCIEVRGSTFNTSFWHFKNKIYIYFILLKSTTVSTNTFWELKRQSERNVFIEISSAKRWQNDKRKDVECKLEDLDYEDKRVREFLINLPFYDEIPY